MTTIFRILGQSEFLNERNKEIDENGALIKKLQARNKHLEDECGGFYEDMCSVMSREVKTFLPSLHLLTNFEIRIWYRTNFILKLFFKESSLGLKTTCEPKLANVEFEM